MQIDFDPERWLHSQFVVGALGALVGLRFAPGPSWTERVLNVGSGAFCAGFFAPALAEWMRIESNGMQSALSFAVGMFGLSLTAAVAQAIREIKLAEIISGWVSRKG